MLTNSLIHFFISLCVSLVGYFHPAAASSQYIISPAYLKQGQRLAQTDHIAIAASRAFIMEAGNGHRTSESNQPRDAENQLREEEETEPSNDSSPLSKKPRKEYVASLYVLPVYAYGNDHTSIVLPTSVHQLNPFHDRYILYGVMRI